jgi:hypothetical protein
LLPVDENSIGTAKCERKNWYHLNAYFSNIAIAIFEFTLFSQKKVITFSLFASFWYQFFASFFIALSLLLLLQPKAICSSLL